MAGILSSAPPSPAGVRDVALSLDAAVEAAARLVAIAEQSGNVTTRAMVQDIARGVLELRRGFRSVADVAEIREMGSAFDSLLTQAGTLARVAEHEGDVTIRQDLLNGIRMLIEASRAYAAGVQNLRPGR